MSNNKNSKDNYYGSRNNKESEHNDYFLSEI